MIADTNKILLCGVGKTGYEVVRKVKDSKCAGIDVRVIRAEREIKQFEKDGLGESELVIVVAELVYANENAFTLKIDNLAKKQSKIVASFLTIPMLMEGKKAIMTALQTAEEIGSVVDASLIINLETFITLPDGRCSFAELINSLVGVEETIADAIQTIMSLISGTSVINIDFEDLKTTLAESGTFTIGSGIGAGENRISLAIENALSSPLMRKCDLPTAKGVLIKVLAPKSSPLIMEEMKVISEFIATLPSRADVKWGIGESDEEVLVSAIILASGFDVKLPE